MVYVCCLSNSTALSKDGVRATEKCFRSWSVPNSDGDTIIFESHDTRGFRRVFLVCYERKIQILGKPRIFVERVKPPSCPSAKCVDAELLYYSIAAG